MNSEFILNPKVDIAVLDDLIIVRSPKLSIKISGTSIKLLLSIVLPLLRRGTSLSEVQSKLTEYDSEQVENFFRQLIESEVIVSLAAYPTPHESPSLRSRFQSQYKGLATNKLKVLLTEGSLNLSQAVQEWKELKENETLLLGFRVYSTYYVSLLSNSTISPIEVWTRIKRRRYSALDIAFQAHIERKPIPNKPFFTKQELDFILSVLFKLIGQVSTEPVLFEVESSKPSVRELPLTEKLVEVPESHLDLNESLTKCFIHDTGIIRSLQRVKFSGFKPDEVIYGAAYSKAVYTTEVSEEDNWGWGADLDPITAQNKAIMEALERYSCGVIERENDQVFTSLNNLEGKAIDPHRLIKFFDWQYELGLDNLPFDPDKDYLWQKGVNIGTGKECWVLGESIFYPIDTLKGKRKLFTYATSSGASAHVSFEKACLGGFLELVEREAFVIHWYNQISPPKLDLDDLPETLRYRLERIKNLGFETYILDMSLDILPVYVALFIGINGNPLVNLGAGCSFEPIEAIEKAISETERIVAMTLNRDWKAKLITEEHIASPLDHMHFYFDEKNFERMKFLLASKRKVPTRQKGFTKDIVAIASSAGLEIVACDLTPAEISATGLGIKIVRVVVPDMVPLSFGFGSDPLAMPRLVSLPKRMGLVDKQLDFSSPVKIPPHPFS